jgi:FAD/FMN-containing dehydrogenase
MVGYVLGGGSSALNGIHSLAIDNLLAVRILTALGSFLTLSPDSLDHERDLYKVICGAGFGFGVVTSITLKAWRISDLGLTGEKVWTHRMIFPPSAIDTAADLFIQLSKPSPQMATTLLSLRAPPSAPLPGAPVLMLILTYFGSASSAEKAFGAAFNPAHATKATMANTALAKLADLNAATDALNRHGDYKTNYSTWAHSITSQKIQAGFEHWLQLENDIPDAKAASYFVVSARDPTAMRAHDLDNEKFFPRTIRERGIFAQAVPWWKDPNNDEACRKWGRDMLDLLGDRSSDAEKVNGFAANLNSDVDVTEIWSHEKLEQIRRLKGIWDPDNVFWNPVVNGM